MEANDICGLLHRRSCTQPSSAVVFEVYQGVEFWGFAADYELRPNCVR